jgi:hypothetical protein
MTRARRDCPVPLLGCERGLVLGMALVVIARGDEVTRAAAAELLHQFVRASLTAGELAIARLAIAGFTAAALRTARWT